MGKRASTRKKSPAKKRKKKPQSSNLRQTLYSLGLWGLGLVNALMIASFIHKHISTGNEQVLSLEEPVRQQQAAPIPRAKSAVAPQAARLKLEILNGCGAQGIANKFAQYLRQAGFQPVNVGNFDNFDMPNTLILDRKSRNRHLGLQVAESLGLPSSFVRYLAKDNARVDVTVIIGKDYPKIDFLQAKK
ncbi:MAG: LytR family transcriptional regulator [Calditrichaeota bacterium]|nr:MAG: LytR family transcriptional regulator [Calditrichota bacterium]